MMKLQQNQVWRQGERFLRIVQLDRMTVDYKLMLDPVKKEGTHHHTTKKEFCRLLKGATLMPHAQMPSVAGESPAGNGSPGTGAEPTDAEVL